METYKYYLRAFTYFIVYSIKADSEYRGRVFGGVVLTVITVLSSVMVVYSFFYEINTIKGWGFSECVVLLGVFIICDGLISVFVYKGLSEISEHVRTGYLDFLLIQPINVLLHVSFRAPNLWKVFDVLFGVGLIIYGVQDIQNLSIYSILFLVISIPFGLIVLYSILLLINTLAIWFINIENVSELYQAILPIARYPADIYPAGVKFLLYTFLPMGFVSTFPAEAMINGLDIISYAKALAISMVFLSLSVLFWKYSLKRYSSASS